MDRPTCKTCPYWDATDTVEVYGPVETETGVHDMTRRLAGVCKRYAQNRPHRGPDDFCGEHPQFPAYIRSLDQTAAPGKPDVERLSTRAQKAAKELGNRLLDATPDEILAVNGVGPATLDEILTWRSPPQIA